MKYGNSGTEVYLACLEANIVSTTPVPMSIPEEAMNPSCVPADKETKRSRTRKEVIRLTLSKNDIYGMLVCIYGGKEGAVIQSTRAFQMPQENAPQIKLSGLRADSKEILEDNLFEYILAGRTGCLLFSVITNKHTEAGEYHSAIELQTEHGFLQVPVIITVLDITLEEIKHKQNMFFKNPLMALLESFDAYQNKSIPNLDDSNSLMNFCSLVALKNFALLKEIEKTDKKRADIISNIMVSLKTGCGDDTAFFRAREQMLKLISEGVCK